MKRFFARNRRPPATARDSAASLTSAWVPDDSLAQIIDRYRSYAVPRLGYATVRDFVDSFEHLNPLATAQGDLKDVQRPWALKSILASVPAGGRIAEIGGGQPYVADLLARLGYEVWLVDPYDGSGNGPTDYELYQRACPDVRFVRARFDDRLTAWPNASLDCVFSISVLEHVDPAGLDAVFRGTARFLKPTGVSIHAIDHVLKGRGGGVHLERLHYIAGGLGVARSQLEHTLLELVDDTETYYLSAESHNRWRGLLPYDEFPMRVCVSIHIASPADHDCVPAPSVATKEVNE